jgi:hypothetical protein
MSLYRILTTKDKTKELVIIRFGHVKELLL